MSQDYQNDRIRETRLSSNWLLQQSASFGACREAREASFPTPDPSVKLKLRWKSCLQEQVETSIHSPSHRQQPPPRASTPPSPPPPPPQSHFHYTAGSPAEVQWEGPLPRNAVSSRTLIQGPARVQQQKTKCFKSKMPPYLSWIIVSIGSHNFRGAKLA